MEVGLSGDHGNFAASHVEPELNYDTVRATTGFPRTLDNGVLVNMWKVKHAPLKRVVCGRDGEAGPPAQCLVVQCANVVQGLAL